MTKRVTRSTALWPPQKVASLTSYVEVGMHSFAEIAAFMGITKNAAIGKAQRLGLEGPRMAKPRWEVRVEFKGGGEGALRKGFRTRDAALDYPVRLAQWKRVWVQETAPERPVGRLERRRA